MYLNLNSPLRHNVLRALNPKVYRTSFQHPTNIVGSKFDLSVLLRAAACRESCAPRRP